MTSPPAQVAKDAPQIVRVEVPGGAVLAWADEATLREARAILDQAHSDPWWRPYKVRLPSARSGAVEVATIKISEAQAFLANLDARRRLMDGVRTYPGTWTVLRRRSKVWMSDTPEEIHDHLGFVRCAEGNVLVTGLGLGVAVKALLAKRTVRRVDVVEVDPDVARLVAPTYARDARFHLHVADAWTWTPPQSVEYDWAWHDIWPSLREANLAEFDRLQARFACVARSQRCWGEEHVRGMSRIAALMDAGADAGTLRRALAELHEARGRRPEEP
jgi:hypothetical protein